MSPVSKRNVVLDTAENLFLERGFQVTGINLIARETGVVVATFCNHFKDKDELIVAVLELTSQAIQEELKEKLAGKSRLHRHSIIGDSHFRVQSPHRATGPKR